MWKLSQTEAIATKIVILLALLWAGLVLGVSFLATPAKFMAVSLSLPVALDIGRHTFNLLGAVEIFLATVVTVAGFMTCRRKLVGLLGLADVIVILQIFWLLPDLDVRTLAVMAGESVPSTHHHLLYAGLDALKILILVITGFLAIQQVSHPVAHQE